jgi:pyruvate dehydrogenase E2 component (dihydrolipoamide acetyltransferase)
MCCTLQSGLVGVNRLEPDEKRQTMPPTATSQRLSPKVRRLLREHGLQARAVAGTGAAGRVTPHDVLGAAGVPRRASAGSVLASPLARRLLREVGLDDTEISRAIGDRRITRVDAERIVDELSAGTATGGTSARPSRTEDAAEAVVDVGRLLAALAATGGDFSSHNGFALEFEVAVASAVAAVLARRPDLAGAAAEPVVEAGRTYPSVHVGFVVPQADAPSVVVVPDAQYLTVAGLARRARAAGERARRGEPTPAGQAAPTVVVATDAVAPDVPGASARLGLLTVDDPTPRRVAGVDSLGYEVVSTRPHATLRLHHAATRVSDEAAASFLAEVANAVTAWSLPVGP